MAGAAPLVLWLLSLLVVSGCAAPAAGLWPAGAGQRTHTIHISLDTWHAMIAIPREAEPERLRGTNAGGDPRLAPRPRFEEWGYAERRWYLEGRQGVSGALRALLWPSAGVVEVTRSDRIWAERTPQPPAEVFAFDLGATSYRRLRRHLRATIAGGEPIAVIGTSRFYAARDAYHAFHQCHQYAARALREAGLPVSALGAFSRSSFARQLRHAKEISEGHVRPPSPASP